MMNKAISFTFLCMFIPFSRCQFCQIRISRNETKDVCCADYEKKENDCIVCSKGYTSDMGQNCKPCSKNYYGERCLYECVCSGFEICDNVEGCLQFSPITDSSVYATSDTLFQRVSDKKCQWKTESGEIKKVCCADFEEKGNDCRACLKGFTSDMGQNCRPCWNNSYGEKCDFVCFCANNEICDHVNGCVPSSSTSGNSVYVTSVDRSLTWMTTTATHYGNDNTTWYIDAQTNGGNMDNRNEDLLSRKIITYYTLTLMVVVPGICLCIIVYQYKTKVTKKKKSKIIQAQKLLLPIISQNIEIEESLYDDINDTDMPGFIEQMDISSDHLDVIRVLNSTAIGEHFSSCDEGQNNSKQNNFKQPVMNMATPKNEDYVTHATVHRIESRVPDTRIQQPYTPRKDAFRLPYEYEICSANVNLEISAPQSILLKVITHKSKSCENLNIESFKSGTCYKTINPTNERGLDFNNITKTKSESDICCYQFVKKE